MTYYSKQILHIQIPPTSYVGLILRSNAVATAKWSTDEGTMRVLYSYCMCSSFSTFCHSSVRVTCIVPATVLRLAVATAVQRNMRPT